VRPYQTNLFDPVKIDIVPDLKVHMNKIVKNSDLSREQVVDKMNDIAKKHDMSLATGNGNRLTLDTFEKWLNPNETNRQMPIKALPVFCAAMKDVSSLDIIARGLGAEVIGPEERRKLEWAEEKLTVQQKLRRIREIEREL